MGTTVSAILRVGDHVALAHIGDSRIYRWRAGELEQITKDHTFVQRLVDSGRTYAAWVRIKQTAEPDLTDRILDGLELQAP